MNSRLIDMVAPKPGARGKAVDCIEFTYALLSNLNGTVPRDHRRFYHRIVLPRKRQDGRNNET